MDNQEDKKEVEYVGGEEGGKMAPVQPSPPSSTAYLLPRCPVPSLRMCKSQKKPTFRTSVLISVSSMILLIIVAVAGWFWGVPSREKKHDQEVEKLENMIEKQQLMIDQLMAEKAETSRVREPQDQYTTPQQEDICSLPPVQGPCTTASIQRWHYHPSSRSCRQFTYGGCLGNSNNFPTLMSCDNACQGHIVTDTWYDKSADGDLRARTYEGRLLEADMTSPQARIMQGLDRVDRVNRGTWFQTVKQSKGGGVRTRRDTAGQLTKEPLGLEVKRHFFSQKVVDPCNNLIESSRRSSSVNMFKNSYDKWMEGRPQDGGKVLEEDVPNNL